MKKLTLSLLCGISLLYSNSDISIVTGKKDYSNSKTKVDGDTLYVNLSHKYENGKISLGYLKDDVKRTHSILNTDLEDLEVEKYNGLYQHSITKAVDLKVSYIKIVDNLAPTDDGKVYGLGAGYKLVKGFGAKIDYFRSDYESFNVSQYDLSLYKGFKVDALKGKFTVGTKMIKIDGDTYNPNDPVVKQYDFYKKKYNPLFVKLGLNYQGYVAGVGAFFGKRMFTVMDDGAKVQHHAMEQDKTYMLSLGKKFENFDIIAKYSFQNGNELPEKQKDVDTKVTSITMKYKF
ncbi:MAG: hypothetical protein U9Q20_04175 [Campylobacterota bacterium]|nr:hypothetical protein [Campylobacterota bacterium]